MNNSHIIYFPITIWISWNVDILPQVLQRQHHIHQTIFQFKSQVSSQRQFSPQHYNTVSAQLQLSIMSNNSLSQNRLVSAFVLSRLDYCNVVLAGLPTATLAPLLRVLHDAARLVVDLRPRDHVSQALQELHWLPIDKRIDYKLCLLVHIHKASMGQAPTYIADMLTPVSSVQSLSTQRSATNGDYIVQRTNRKLGERAFSVATPKAWNRLPTKLKTSTCSTDSFKRSLKTFLFQSSYGCETRVG